MAMTKQEAKVQLAALAREVAGHETAISNWESQIAEARENGDEAEARRLERETQASTRTIRVANEQIALLSGRAQTRQQKGTKRA